MALSCVVTEDVQLPEAVHPAVGAALAALDAAGARWVLLRGAQELARPTGDVDLLVAPAALPGLDAVLAAAGLHRLRAPGRGTHRFYSGLSHGERAADDLWVQLDVVTDLAFGGHQEIATDLAAGCLDRRRRVDGLWRPAPADEGWLLVLHALLDKATVGHRAAQVRAAVAALAPTDPVARAVDEACGPGTSARVLDLLGTPGPDRERAAAAALRSGWSAGRRLRTGARRLVNRAVRRLDLSPPAQVRPGLVVAVMGPDGAGKTTLVEALRADLPVTSVRVHTGVWRAGRHDALAARLPGGRTAQRLGRVATGSAVARYHRARGRLVLLDRCVYDCLLPGAQDDSLGGRLVQRAMLASSPVPDLAVFLDVPGEVMFARKGEHTAELLEQRRHGYRELAGTVPGSVVLDGTAPPGQLLRDTAARVWDRHVARDRRAEGGRR